MAPLGTPCKPLAPSWHCLGTSKSYFGSLGTPNIWFSKVLGAKFHRKIEDLSVMLLISAILSCFGFVLNTHLYNAADSVSITLLMLLPVISMLFFSSSRLVPQRVTRSANNPQRSRRQPPACGIISRFDMHFVHVSILDMQIACPDMTLVMS